MTAITKKSSTEQYFKVSPEWAISPTTKGIQISAGDDMVYDVACDKDTADFFCRLPKLFTRKSIPESGLIIFEQLLSAEVIVPSVSLTKNQTTRINVVSDSSSVAKQVSEKLKQSGYAVEPTNPDITIIIRAGQTITNFLKTIKYAQLRSVHIFVDLAYHHTISIGPLVFPGDTPCIACLEGRLVTRWGSQTPPINAKASKELLDLAYELTRLEIQRYERNDTSLAFKTIAHDTDQRSVETYKLLTVPQCPYCMNVTAYANGMLVI